MSNCDNIQRNNLNPGKILNSLVNRSPFFLRHHIYDFQTFKYSSVYMAHPDSAHGVKLISKLHSIKRSTPLLH